MRQFTADEIQQKFDQLPKELQDAISSPEINLEIQNIGKMNGLHIDQIGDLVDQIGLVMLGLEKGSNFVTDITERLSVSNEIAAKIADEVNKNVFSAIKTSMREMTEKKESQLDESQNTPKPKMTVESIGNFVIEKKPPITSFYNEVSENDRAKMIDHLENPPWLKNAESVGPTEPAVDLLPEKAEPDIKPTEALPVETKVEQKIETKLSPELPKQPVMVENKPTVEPPTNLPTNNNSNIEQNTVVQTPPVPNIPKPETPKPTVNTVPIRKPGFDPYKEPIE